MLIDREGYLAARAHLRLATSCLAGASIAPRLSGFQLFHKSSLWTRALQLQRLTSSRG